MNKVIIPTGYMGSGSSAVTDLLREFRGFESFDESFNGSFEYVFLHCPDGLFDLEDKLLVGNNALRSDEAIHKFERCMKDLYQHRFWWVGNYKKYLHSDFMKITEEYIKKIVQYYPSEYWYMQQKYGYLDLLKLCFRKLVFHISLGKIKLKLPLKWSQMKLSLIEPKKFYEISREYLNSVFDCLGIRDKNLILDQLLLPHNLWRMDNYFNENVECFVVERDPRDVFILNKYLWTKQDVSLPYPTDARVYCEFYKRLRNIEKKTDNPHIHRIYFEDLVYNYEESIQKICKALSVKPSDHIEMYKYFDPKISIKNTQLFRSKNYEEEIQLIENKLAEYLYEFPFYQECSIENAF